MLPETSLTAMNLSLPPDYQEALDLSLGLFGGDHLATINWLQTPVLGLGSQKPVDLLQSPEGRAQVIELIWKLENGVGI